MVIWKPNDTIKNRFWQRFGFGIDNQLAQERREMLRNMRPEETGNVEREIETQATNERVKQIHYTLKKMMNNWEKAQGQRTN